MALRASELILIVRAQNQASSTLRAVSRDLRGMGTASALTGRQLSESQITSARRWAAVGRGASVLRDTGRSVRIFGLAAGAGLAYAATSAAKFEQQATLAATQTGKIGTSFERVQKNAKPIMDSILAQMRKFPAASQDMAQASYEIFSSTNLGVDSLSKGMRLLSLMNKASVAGMTPLMDVTKASVTVMNDFGFTVKQMPRVLDRMFAAVRFGRMTFAEFTQSLSTTAPATRAAGQSFDTLAGTMAFLTRRIPNVRMAAVGYARLLEVLSRKDFVEGAKKLGVTITDTHKRLLPLPEVITRLVTKFPELRKGGTVLQNFFKQVTAATGGRGLTGTIQARRAFTYLALGLTSYRAILNQVKQDNNEFGRSYRAMVSTSGVQWGIFLNRLKSTALVIGADVIPTLLELSKPLKDLIKWWENLDKSTRHTIIRWAAISAAFALVGGTIASLIGGIVGLVALMGQFSVLGRGMALILLAVFLAAQKAGHGADAMRIAWTTALHALESFFAFSGSSVGNFVVGLGIALLAVRKLSTAMKGLAVASGAAGAAEGGGLAAGGLLAGLSRRRTQLTTLQRGAAEFSVLRRSGGTDLRAMGQTEQALSRASRASMLFKGSMNAAGFAAMALPGPTKVAALAILGFAGAAYLFHRRAEAAAKKAQELAASMAAFKRLLTEPTARADAFSNLGLDTRNVERAHLAVALIKDDMKDLRKQIAAASPTDRGRLQRQLRGLQLDLADAQDAVGAANQKANVSFNQLGLAMSAHVRQLAEIGRASNQLKKDRAELAAMDPFHPDFNRVVQLKSAIDRLSGGLDSMKRHAVENAQAISAAMGKVLRDLQRSGEIPQIGQRTTTQLKLAMSRAGRMFTVPEMKQFIRLSLDPKALSKAKGDIATLVRWAKGQTILIDAKVKAAKKDAKAGKDFAKAIGSFTAQVKVPNLGGQAKGSRASAAKIFAKTIHQKVHIDVPTPPAAQVGASIIAGMQSGVYGASPGLSQAVASAVSAAITAGKAAARAQSPSKRTRDEIGIPLVQGIIQGIMLKYGDLQNVSRLSYELFAGPWLQSEALNRRIDGVKERIAKLRKEMRELRAKKGAAPQGDVEAINKQVDALQKKITYLRRHGAPIGMPDLQKDLNLQLKQLQKFNYAMTRLAARGVPRELLDQLAELGIEGAKMLAILAGATEKQLRRYVNTWKKAQREITRSQRITMLQGKDFVEQGAHKLLDLWNEFMGKNQDAMGALFSGLSDFSASAVASLISDLTQQLSDAKDELANAQAELLNHFADQFGALFSGDILANRGGGINWGIALGFKQLAADLEGQIKKFEAWREDIGKLLSRGIPTDMIKELEGLGISSADAIHAIANMTDEELTSYIGLWNRKRDAIGKAASLAIPSTNELMGNIVKILDKIVEIQSKLAKASLPVTPEQLLGDIKKQITAFGDWQGALEALRQRNIPGELLQQLKDLGPDALPFLRGLLQMTEPQLQEYIGLWNTMQATLTAATKQDMADRIALWRQHGSDIAAAIIAGVMDEQYALLDFFRNMFKDLLGESRREIGAGSIGSIPRENIISSIRSAWGPLDTFSLNAAPNSGGVVNMTIHAVENPSLSSLLERAAFRIRNRPIT